MKHFLLPILSGILIGTSYIPFQPWALLFCFVPLWLHFIRSSNLKQIFWGAWICQFTLTLIGFNWVAHTVREFGNIPFPINYLVLFCYCAFANLHFALSGGLWWFLKKYFKNSVSQWALLPLCYSLCELSFPMIFDWHFGYTWYWLGWPAYHMAEWVGFRGLSQITVLLNFIALVIWLKRGSTKVWATGLSTLTLLVAALQILGLSIQKQIEPPNAEFQVGIVQANIGNLEKQYAEKGRAFRDHIVGKYLLHTTELLTQKTTDQPIDFVIWPETAFPEPIGYGKWDTRLLMQARQFLKENQLALITGAYGWHGDDDDTPVSNSILAFDSEGQPHPEYYQKTVLLAFGEYFPGAEWFPILRKWVPAVGDFRRGEGPKLLNFQQLLLGPQICYEGLFDHLSRRSANLGAEILINVTNDSWYGTWQEPYQHLYMTLARAIEVRRPLVRSTNTGISTVVLADGSILAQSPLHREWSQLYQVPYRKNPRPTLFQGWGFYFVWFVIGLGSLLILGWEWRERTQKSRLVRNS